LKKLKKAKMLFYQLKKIFISFSTPHGTQSLIVADEAQGVKS
jgi:hypothetical protein